MPKNNYPDILKQYWGYDCFRGIQEAIINSIGEGKDTLGLMPTGGGKSITFQVPALAREGMCIVITPLIALMKDQVQNLKRRGIKALAIYSGMSRQEIIVTLENCIFGNYKFLYISPERLDTEIFRVKLRKMHISMITVDESHCISQWGYDFRPAYLKIAEIRELLPDVPVLALTATATPEVVTDIQERLHFKEPNVFRMSFERSNLAYVVRNTEDKNWELLHILRRMSGSAIVYVRSRRRTKEIKELLVHEGITADFYHAGMDEAAKDVCQQRWQEGESRVMVATNAFGMGIDKPDVRLVIHMDVPDSIEAYFQEAGRAGRDGAKAYAVILYQPADKTKLNKRIADMFPEKEYIRKVYEHLQYYYQMAMGDGQDCVREFSIEDFCQKFKHFPIQVDSALKLLTLAGYLTYTDEQENASRMRFIIRREELYKLQNMDEEVDSLILTLMRSYTGIFTEHVFIDESAIATRIGLTRRQVYDHLIRLSKQRIIDYIPRKRTPYIIYTRARVDQRLIHLPESVYEERRERYRQRIYAMLDYITTSTACRSRILLHYFGEKSEHNCGQCDVCLSKRSLSDAPPRPAEEIRKEILQLVANRPCSPGEIAKEINADTDTIAELIRELLEEKEVFSENGIIHYFCEVPQTEGVERAEKNERAEKSNA